jgi:hypothetical protein
MGSAEYEFGTIPRAFHTMASKIPELEETTLTISGKAHTVGYIPDLPKDLDIVRNTTLHILCPKTLTETLHANLLSKGYNNWRTKGYHCPDSTFFGEIQKPHPKKKKAEYTEGKLSGWFLVEETCFLTKNADQFQALKILLGLTPSPNA